MQREVEAAAAVTAVQEDMAPGDLPQPGLPRTNG